MSKLRLNFNKINKADFMKTKYVLPDKEKQTIDEQIKIQIKSRNGSIVSKEDHKKTHMTDFSHNPSELLSLAHFVYIQMINEYKNQKVKRPKLLQSIAFTKYNDDLNLDPIDPVAVFITSYLNDRIIRDYYSNRFEYEDIPKETQNLIK